MTEMVRPPADHTGRPPTADGPADPGARPATGRYLTALLRRIFWKCVLFCLGGVTVRGRLPRGGCVVVANHCSHADTVALIAALDARHAPRVAAASDYWSASRLRKFVCTRLAGAFMIRRQSGGYLDLRRGAGPLLAAGHAVVVFPEGTRDGSGLAPFRRGAFDLAAAYGVPVVPVAVCDTDKLLGKGKRLTPHPIGVRIGAPLREPAAEPARAAVAELLAAHQLRDSRLRRKMAALAMSRWGMLIVALWAFTEAFSWPLLPELLLAVFCLAAPRAGLRLAVTAAVSSVVGGMLALLLYSGTGLSLPEPLTTPQMHAVARQQIEQEGAAAMEHQPAGGIPYKVYNVEAGHAHVAALPWLRYSSRARGGRILLLGLALSAVGFMAQRLRRFYPLYLTLLVTLFGSGLTLIVLSWSR
jgi:1-acyl-sn-glycerol-3-phosphate acyltransferase